MARIPWAGEVIYDGSTNVHRQRRGRSSRLARHHLGAAAHEGPAHRRSRQLRERRLGRLSPRAARTGLRRWPQCRDGMALGGRQGRSLSRPCDRARAIEGGHHRHIEHAGDPGREAGDQHDSDPDAELRLSRQDRSRGKPRPPGRQHHGLQQRGAGTGGQEAAAAQGDGAEGLARGRAVESGEPDRGHGVPGRAGGGCRGRPGDPVDRGACGRTTTRRPSRP